MLFCIRCVKDIKEQRHDVLIFKVVLLYRYISSVIHEWYNTSNNQIQGNYFCFTYQVIRNHQFEKVMLFAYYIKGCIYAKTHNKSSLLIKSTQKMRRQQTLHRLWVIQKLK